MDNASGFSGMNFMNFNLSRALSSFDITHNFRRQLRLRRQHPHAVGGLLSQPPGNANFISEKTQAHFGAVPPLLQRSMALAPTW
jgi:hypothetical protein